jgi:hypothetical protein
VRVIAQRYRVQCHADQEQMGAHAKRRNRIEVGPGEVLGVSIIGSYEHLRIFDRPTSPSFAAGNYVFLSNYNG